MAEKVSYRQRDCEDQERIEEFLTQSRVGLLGLAGQEYPYVVPVNYVWHDGAAYFHGMGSGKKTRLLAQQPAVTFVVFAEHGTVLDRSPCHADTAYLSVMIFGRAERLTDPKDSARALQQVVDKYAPGQYRARISAELAENYRSDLDDNPVGVYRIVPEHLTAKENRPEESRVDLGGAR